MINKNDDINLTQLELNEKFIIACYEGHLDVVQYLLTSPDLIRHANINAQNNKGFLDSCQNGDLDIVKFLLTSPDLIEHVDIHVNNDEGFKWACLDGELEIVKFLLTSPDLIEHVDIHTGFNMGFLNACNNKHLDIIKYFIFDMNIQKTGEIEYYLEQKPNMEVENMFNLRDLNNKLEKELKSTKVNQKKMKV